MTKHLVFVSLLSTLLCGPALAGTPPQQTLDIDLRIDAGRHYALKLVDADCGRVSAKAPGFEDNIKICARTDRGRILLDVDWATRQGDHEIHNDSKAAVQRGSSFDLDGGTAKLTVSLHT